MTTGTKDDAEPTEGQDAAYAAERGQIESSMRDFAESASALAAASLRMQLMMLEQTREMFSAFSAMEAAANARGETKDRPE
jgi:hypothetical protein